MAKFKVGDRVKILPGVGTPFVGGEGNINEVQPNDQGIETLDRYIVVFERREKRSFYRVELTHVLTASARPASHTTPASADDSQTHS